MIFNSKISAGTLPNYVFFKDRFQIYHNMIAVLIIISSYNTNNISFYLHFCEDSKSKGNYLFIYTLMHTNYKLKTNYQTTTSGHQVQ